MFTEKEFKEIGEKIKQQRKKKKWKQIDLETNSGVSRATISRIENGNAIKMEAIELLSEALGLNVRKTLGLDTVSDNVDDFISLFCKILYSDDNRLEIDGIIKPSRLICHCGKNNLVLYISDKLYTLFNDVAQAYSEVQGVEEAPMKEQIYKELLQDAKNKYKRKKLNIAKPYFLLSEKQLAEVIKKSVNERKYFDEIMKSLQSEE